MESKAHDANTMPEEKKGKEIRIALSEPPDPLLQRIIRIEERLDRAGL